MIKYNYKGFRVQNIAYKIKGYCLVEINKVMMENNTHKKGANKIEVIYIEELIKINELLNKELLLLAHVTII